MLQSVIPPVLASQVPSALRVYPVGQVRQVFLVAHFEEAHPPVVVVRQDPSVLESTPRHDTHLSEAQVWQPLLQVLAARLVPMRATMRMVVKVFIRFN